MPGLSFFIMLLQKLMKRVSFFVELFGIVKSFLKSL